jgi:glycosyltransferase involved in cell wall biosynthesis
MGYNAVPNAVIYNGYDPDFFFPDEDTRTACRCALGIPDATFAIGSAGRWHAQKDIPNLLRATKLLRDRGVPVVCLLVGGGLDEGNAELNAEIRSAGCDGDVIALGAQANVHDYYRAMDLHVLASSGSEAFPNVVAESMLCGTPNAVTDVGDSALIVGDTGWVMPPRDAVKLADAIEQARQERSGQAAEWKERRDSARKRIVEHFTFERMANAYEDVWRQVARDWKSARWSGR